MERAAADDTAAEVAAGVVDDAVLRRSADDFSFPATARPW
jgi:hypothetical protein